MQKTNQDTDKLYGKNIVFFDGVCVLCNSSVDFLMKVDKKQRLQYASLQGVTAKKILRQEDLGSLESIVFYSNNKVTQRSNAVLGILDKVGGIWKVFLVFKIIPRFIRDSIYNWLAKYRYQWFGRRGSCRMPEKKDEGRILP